MNTLFKGAAFACLTALAACGGTSSPEKIAQATAASQVEAAECAMYAAAYNLSGARYGKANPTILKDCPGAPRQPGSFAFNGLNFRDMKTSVEFANSMTANVDGIEEVYGKRGVDLFRKMIARGTSKAIAREIVGTPEYVAAVQAFQNFDTRYN